MPLCCLCCYIIDIYISTRNFNQDDKFDDDDLDDDCNDGDAK